MARQAKFRTDKSSAFNSSILITLLCAWCTQRIVIPWPTKNLSPGSKSSPPETAKAQVDHACGFLCLSLFCARAYPIRFRAPVH
ncbi:hypothetical protein BDV11DRAFT_188230 [Aspergillus similis]